MGESGLAHQAIRLQSERYGNHNSSPAAAQMGGLLGIRCRQEEVEGGAGINDSLIT